MSTKVCSKCGEEKELSEFCKHKIEKDGLSSICKQCKKQQDFLYRNTQSGKESHRRANKIYRKKNREKRKEYNKEWIKNDPEYYNRYYHTHKQEARKSHKKYEQQRRKESGTFRMIKSLRTRINQAIKNNIKTISTKELLGANIGFVRRWIESQWEEGMSWKNYGYYGWHIDHCFPCSKFDLRQTYEQKICFYWFNLQPMWAKENIKKGNKLFSY